MRARRRLLRVASLGAACALAACGAPARLPVVAGSGPAPTLPPPSPSLIPVMKVAPARGWTGGATPIAAEGAAVAAFARGLQHPRWLYVLPNGDVLVAETNAPPGRKAVTGIKGWFFNRFQKQAGGAVPSPERITLLRDADGDGVAELRSALLDSANGLHAPFGMVLVGRTLYVANTDALVRFPFTPGETRIAARAETVASLPAGRINYHWTKSLVASPDGRRLYVGVGSNSNAGERGLSNEAERAAVWEIDPATGSHRVFASGLRNPVGMAWVPETGALWVAVNERDELGSDLVPDYMTALRPGRFYGWPWSYYGGHVDARVKPRRPDMVAAAVAPDYALGPHTASLGLAWSDGSGAAPRAARGMYVGQHGSWNREPPSGYRVVFVPFDGGHPAGPPAEVLTGFLDREGRAYGRPVGVAIDRTGALLVADDVGNAVWRVRHR